MSFSAIDTITLSRSEYAFLKERQENSAYLKRVIEEQKQEIAQAEIIRRMDVKEEQSNTQVYKVLFGLTVVIITILIVYIEYTRQ